MEPWLPVRCTYLPRFADARRSPQHVNAKWTLSSLPFGPPCFSQYNKTPQKQNGGPCSRQDIRPSGELALGFCVVCRLHSHFCQQECVAPHISSPCTLGPDHFLHGPDPQTHGAFFLPSLNLDPEVGRDGSEAIVAPCIFPTWGGIG